MATITTEDSKFHPSHAAKNKSVTILGYTVTHFLIFIAVFIFSLTLASCGKPTDSRQSSQKIKVVTTLFPVYDFTKNVGGKFVDVSLLLPPGTEAHTFEPRPADITRINSADLFIFTTLTMEPWVSRLLKGIDSQRLLVLEAGQELDTMKHKKETTETTHDEHAEVASNMHETAGGVDPHIWLDFDNASRMTEKIAKGLVDRDPQNRDYYLNNASLFTGKLKALDEKYVQSLKACRKRVIVHAGHFAFGYMAKRYHLEHISAYRGFSPNAEPTPRALAELSRTVKKERLKYVFIEELITPKAGEAISRETGVEMLLLHGAHNISKSELDNGVTFLSLMEANLVNLRKGLQCQ